MEGGFLPEPNESPAQWEPAGQRYQQPVHRQQQHNQQPRPTQHWAPRHLPAAAAAPPGRYVPPAAGGGGVGGCAEPDGDNLESHGGCSRCTSLSFNSEWLKAFGVVLCNQCKRSESLISKSTAKQRYSLSDSDLSRLGNLRKANPHKKDWQAMHLYMESQVARVAHDKHGGAEGLQQLQHARLEARMESKLRRREEEKRREATAEARLLRIRQRIEAVDEAGQQQCEEAGAAASGSDVEEI